MVCQITFIKITVLSPNFCNNAYNYIIIKIKYLADEANLYLALFQFALLGLQGYFLVDGNKMTAKYYLNQGFRIENDDEFVKKQVKIAWKFTDDVFVENNLKEEK